MPKLISRAYDDDKLISCLVMLFEGPVNDANINQIREIRAAMEMELKKAVSIGDGRKINALREALQDISS